jgi:hypothetical protein
MHFDAGRVCSSVARVGPLWVARKALDPQRIRVAIDCSYQQSRRLELKSASRATSHVPFEESARLVTHKLLIPGTLFDRSPLSPRADASLL